MKLASIWNSFKANTRRTKVVTAFTLAILLWGFLVLLEAVLRFSPWPSFRFLDGFLLTLGFHYIGYGLCLLWAIAGFFKRNAWFFLPILLCLGTTQVLQNAPLVEWGVEINFSRTAPLRKRIVEMVKSGELPRGDEYYTEMPDGLAFATGKELLVIRYAKPMIVYFISSPGLYADNHGGGSCAGTTIASRGSGTWAATWWAFTGSLRTGGGWALPRPGGCPS